MTDPTTAAQLARFEKMSGAELLSEYQKLFGETPRCRNRTWLYRTCAWKIQELHYGGLSPTARERLEALIDDAIVPDHPIARGHLPSRRKPGDPAPGTTLTREWHGTRVEVRVTAEGYEWDGRVYRSLSAVALAITGSRWNGKLFFGLAERHRKAAP